MTPLLHNITNVDLAALRDGMTSEICTRLVEQHRGLVMAACCRILRDSSLAEDAAQETFLLLTKKARHLPPQTSLPGWLYQTACRTALNLQRQARRRRVRESSPEAADSTLPQAPSEQWSELEAHLDEAMLKLTQRQRDLVIQCYFENQPQRAAAQALGISETVVSRELARAIESLRRFLAKRGVGISGATLVALLSTHAAKGVALSATPLLVSAMMATAKAGASASVATFTGQILALTTAMKLPLSAATTLLLVLAGYDLASSDSSLMYWLTGASHSEPPAGVNSKHGQNSRLSLSADEKAKWLAEARDIWAGAPRIPQQRLQQLMSQFLTESDPEKQFPILQDMGIKIQRSAFDQLVTTRTSAPAQSYQANFHLLKSLWKEFIRAHPREAVAWAYATSGYTSKDLNELDTVLAISAPSQRRNVAAWAAFMETSPDPRIPAHAQLWLEEWDHPGSIWAKAKEVGIEDTTIGGYLKTIITDEASSRSLPLLLGSPDAAFKSHHILALVPRLTTEQLLELADQHFTQDAEVANLLRATAGDPTASFEGAHAFLLKSTDPDPSKYDRTYADWAIECARTLYKQWLKLDPTAVLNPMLISSNRAYQEALFSEGVRSGNFTEDAVLQWLSETEPSTRDVYLATFYSAQEADDPERTLRRITQSNAIEDQVTAAKAILGHWARTRPEAAATWIEGLPVGADRQELAAEVASIWVGSHPKEALAYVQQQGLGLDALVGSLAFALRNQSEVSIQPLLQPFREDPDHDKVIVMTAGYRLPSQPDAAFRFMADHAVGDWQEMAVTEIARWLELHDSRSESFAQALSAQDLTSVSQERLQTLAERYIRNLAQQDQLEEALDWTLSLPVQAASQARSSAAQFAPQNIPYQTKMRAWIQKATLPAEEKSALFAIIDPHKRKGS
ncbi:RNA polymerase sigma factor, sigma-70 family [Prosthecobacter debontii]|uniref:RNA polymerase sigma factor, sigma-70 family n=1 Tax=Prosthecobacter debontii TaxID=48467 RepID=A0A1T4YVU4_9BACT|nr:sigma-70 family RNA polymerase sigma factor [Prosthecobacter debontii]SKB05967.1 RNA polymerase sigma factor, sigma-70 family [Prosthecobacter debontii]